MLSALALFGAATEVRVAALAVDRIIARSAGLEGLGHLHSPPDLAELCVAPPLVAMERVITSLSGGSARLRWRHLGAGMVRVDVEGMGRIGARHRLVALVRVDSSGPSASFTGCPTSTRLVPAGPGWLEGHPEG